MDADVAALVGGEPVENPVVQRDEAGQHVVTVNGGILSQPTERTRLLLKKAAQRSELSPVYGSVQDLENCRAVQQRSIVGGATTFRQFRAGPCQSLWAYANPKHWSRQQIWLKGLRQPLSFIPSVLLGLLLNILDALSYGGPMAIAFCPYHTDKP